MGLKINKTLLAKVLGVSRPTVHQWHKRGLLRSHTSEANRRLTLFDTVEVSKDVIRHNLPVELETLNELMAMRAPELEALAVQTAE